MANTERNAARLQALAAAVLFSTGGAGIKVDSFTATQVSAVRSGIAALAILLWLRGRIRWTWQAVAAGVVYAATLSLYVGAVKLTTSAHAIFLQATAPLYLVLLAPVVLKERVRRNDIVYLAGIAIGMILCFAGRPAPTATAPNPAVGNWFGIASGFTWALTLLTLRRIGRDDTGNDATVGAVVVGNAFACLGALPFALPLPHGTPTEWATLVYLGGFQIGLAYVCLSNALRRLPALEISLLLLLEPVLNPLWTWLIRGENPGRWTILGGVVIVSATVIKLLSEARRPEPDVNTIPAV